MFGSTHTHTYTHVLILQDHRHARIGLLYSVIGDTISLLRRILSAGNRRVVQQQHPPSEIFELAVARQIRTPQHCTTPVKNCSVFLTESTKKKHSHLSYLFSFSSTCLYIYICTVFTARYPKEVCMCVLYLHDASANPTTTAAHCDDASTHTHTKSFLTWNALATDLNRIYIEFFFFQCDSHAPYFCWSSSIAAAA